MKVALVLLLATSVLGFKIKERIIGGDTAYTAQFSFVAAITVTTNESRYFCGGSLIGPEWILTAGQCANGATLFTINLGSNSLTGNDPNRLTVATSEYVLHPDFNPLTLENDIALIRLRGPITYGDYVQRVFLAYGNLSDYTNLVAVGWGQTSDYDPNLSNDLKYVAVAAVPNADCQAVYGNQISDHMVCVAGEYNQGTCTGDSGGPLLHYEGSVRRHVGAASFISGNGCESTDPSGFTRTYSYKPWITSVTGIIS